MKKKYFFRGLGAGIILSAVVTAVSVNQNNSLSDDEIRTRAKQLGMVEAEKETKEEKTKETKEAKTTKTKNPKKTKEVKETEEPVATVASDAQKFVDTGKSSGSYATEEPKQTSQPEITQKPAETKKTSATKKPQSSQKKYISVTIEAGMWSDEISKKFKELGLVDNAEAFDDFLCDNGYASMIKVGVYEVPTNATYTEIANIITK